MERLVLDRKCGRTAFGRDPAAYHAARPPYPEWVFDTLRERCGLCEGAATLEIGAGTGTATERLLELGAKPLVAVEPDPRSAVFLRARIPGEGLTVLTLPFEEVDLDAASFDLAVSATAFHWLDEDEALIKIARLLKPGGWWAALWHVFGDDSRPDPFHEATRFLSGPESPSAGMRGIPFALDAEARLEALESSGLFDSIEPFTSAWSLLLDADQVAALYATFSNINTRDDRDLMLAELSRVAREQFDNRVTRNMTTSLYIARRRPGNPSI